HPYDAPRAMPPFAPDDPYARLPGPPGPPPGADRYRRPSAYDMLPGGGGPPPPPMYPPHYPPGDGPPRRPPPADGPLTYKQFIADLDDDVSPADAEKRYLDYKTKFVAAQKKAFFHDHRNDEWLRALYDPARLESLVDSWRASSCLKACSAVMPTCQCRIPSLTASSLLSSLPRTPFHALLLSLFPCSSCLSFSLHSSLPPALNAPLPSRLVSPVSCRHLTPPHALPSLSTPCPAFPLHPSPSPSPPPNHSSPPPTSGPYADPRDPLAATDARRRSASFRPSLAHDAATATASAPRIPAGAGQAARVAHDLERARALVGKLDAEKGLWGAQGGAEGGNFLVGENQAGAEDEVVKIRVPAGEGGGEARWLAGVALLDAVLTYLWRVHGADYYGGTELRGLPKGLRHVRADEGGEGKGEGAGGGEAGEGFEAWARRVDEKWRVRVGAEGEDPVVALVGKARVEARMGGAMEGMVRKIKDDKYGWKYGCSAPGCSKLFHGPEFVIKHLKLKHPEQVAEQTNRVKEEVYEENYMRDPNAPVRGREDRERDRERERERERGGHGHSPVPMSARLGARLPPPPDPFAFPPDRFDRPPPFDRPAGGPPPPMGALPPDAGEPFPGERGGRYEGDVFDRRGGRGRGGEGERYERRGREEGPEGMERFEGGGGGEFMGPGGGGGMFEERGPPMDGPPPPMLMAGPGGPLDGPPVFDVFDGPPPPLPPFGPPMPPHMGQVPPGGPGGPFGGPLPPVLIPVPGAGPLGPFLPAPPDLAARILRDPSFRPPPSLFDGFDGPPPLPLFDGPPLDLPPDAPLPPTSAPGPAPGGEEGRSPPPSSGGGGGARGEAARGRAGAGGRDGGGGRARGGREGPYGSPGRFGGMGMGMRGMGMGMGGMGMGMGMGPMGMMPMMGGPPHDPRGMRSYRDLDAPDDEVTVIDYRSL
ncbi:unnamed protein product, partial [Closterium sp. NIES-65]